MRMIKVLCVLIPIALVALGMKSFMVARQEPRIAFSVTYESFGSKPGGPIVVGWDDGLVVFAMNPDIPGQHMQCGWITPEQVLGLLAELKDAGFFAPQMVVGAIPDNSTTTITASNGEPASHTWNEALSTAWGANINSDPRFKQFTRMWALSRHAIAFAHPAKAEPLSQNPAELNRFEGGRGSNWRATASRLAVDADTRYSEPAAAANAPTRVSMDRADPRYVLTGRLNKPIGELMTLQGVIVDGPQKGYEGGPNLKVQRINGEFLQNPIQIPISPYFGEWGDRALLKISTGKTFELVGYESGTFVGIPTAAYKLGGIDLQTSDHHFSSAFHVVRGKEIDPISEPPAKLR